MAGATSSDRTSSSIVQILLSYCLKLNINAQATRICRSGLNMRTEITLPRQSEREDWTDYGIFFLLNWKFSSPGKLKKNQI